MSSKKGFFDIQTVWLAAVDAACLLTAIVAGVQFHEWLCRYESVRNWVSSTTGIWLDPMLETSLLAYVKGHVGGWVYFCGSIVLANYVVGSYGVRVTTSRFNLIVNWIFSLGIALLVLSVTSYAWFQQLLGRGVLAFLILTYALLSLLTKSLLYGVVLRSRPFVCRTALLGTGEQARQAREIVEAKNVLPTHVVVAYVAAGGGEVRDNIDGVAVVTPAAKDLARVVQNLGVNLLLVCPDNPQGSARYYPMLRRLRFSGVEVMDGLAVAEIYTGRIPLDLVNDTWLQEASMEPSLAVVSRLKRICDVITTLLASVVCIPLGLLVAIVSKLTSPRSPVMYTQDRVGLFGTVFRIYKFRTMIHHAEESVGAVWAEKDDKRITRLGRVLRKFRLDEIPQLWNVIKGEMSIVGPRPERPEFVERLEKDIPYYRERENVLPGLTGWAQVQYPYTASVEDAAHKIEYDLYYIKNLSLGLDLQVVLRTLRIVVCGKERSV